MDQRYYNQAGRFFSPDRGGIATASSSNPHSWNRYNYANGDPINAYGPTGRMAIIWDQPTALDCIDGDPNCGDPCYGGGLSFLEGMGPDPSCCDQPVGGCGGEETPD